MNKTSITVFALLITILSTLSACNSSNTSQSQLEKTTEIGKPIIGIGENIWAIYQDKAGNYWFGSKENGVFLYNGKGMRKITTQDGLVSNEIRGFQEDASGNIYIETTRGISKFDGLSFSTLQMANSENAPNRWALNPEDLWFRTGFTNNGIYRYDGEYLHLLKLSEAPQEAEFRNQNQWASYSPYALYTIYKDRKGVVWFGTSSLGVCRFDGKTLSWHYEPQLQTTPSGGDFGTRAVFEDSKGKFWINNTRFRYKLGPNSSTEIDFEKEEGVGFLGEANEKEFPFFLSITEDNQGNLWMVTYANGVWKFNGEELIHYPIKNGETEVLLFTIYKDHNGALWLGSQNAGVFKFNGKSFEKMFSH